MIEGNVYLKNNVEGMNNDELILFIYQEMLKILNQAVHYFENEDIEKRVNAINKGIEVTNSLLSVLNFELGGEIAVRLRALYLYSIKKLTTANFNKDPKPVQEVIKIFRDLYSGWAQKMEKDRKEQTTAAPLPNYNAPVSDSGAGQMPKGGLEIYG